jgi:SAM-dependent methyltransferase
MLTSGAKLATVAVFTIDRTQVRREPGRAASFRWVGFRLALLRESSARPPRGGYLSPRALVSHPRGGVVCPDRGSCRLSGATAGARDTGTEAYFDTWTPEYDAARFAPAAEWIRRLGGEDASLVDVGCGSGNVLAYLQEATGLRRLAGLDVSPRYLEQARARVGCETHQGSILDPGVVARLGGRFDFAVLGAVLHHLVGPTRRASRERARLALSHALALVRPGGHLIVVEPVFYPPWMMDVVFYVKSLAVKLTSRRLELFGQWNNLGAPVVSYYTNEELERMVTEDPRAEMLDLGSAPAYLSSLQRAAFIRRREDTTLVIRRGEDASASSSARGPAACVPPAARPRPAPPPHARLLS